MESMFEVEDNKGKIEDLKYFISESEKKRESLIPVLEEAQKIFGYLPTEIIQMVSKDLKIPISEVYGVITFYAHFLLLAKGEYEIGVCLNTDSYVKNNQEILNELVKQLEIGVGETTPDMKFSISAEKCFDACKLSTTLAVNEDLYNNVKAEDIKDIIEKYR